MTIHNAKLEVIAEDGIEIVKSSSIIEEVYGGGRATFKARIILNEFKSHDVILRVVSDEQIKEENITLVNTEKKVAEVVKKIKAKKNILFIGLVVTLFIISLTIISFMYVFFKNKKNKLNQQLLEYIRFKRSKNIGDDLIKNELKKIGWKEEDIERHMRYR